MHKSRHVPPLNDLPLTIFPSGSAQQPHYGQSLQPGSQDPYGQPQHQQGQQQSYDPNQGGPWGQGPPPSGDPQNPYGYDRDPSDPNNPQEGERGFLGAMAGGMGGGVFGHKHNHGIIGTLAGAFLGSKMEDAFKGRHSRPSSSHSGRGRPHGRH